MAHAESDGNERKSALCDSAEDLGSLTADGKTEQDTRGRVQETIPGGEGTGEDRSVNDVWEDLDSCTIDGNDVWAEGKESEILYQTKYVGNKFTSERRYRFDATILDRHRVRACL